MRYIWEAGKKRRQLHIMEFSRSGQMSMKALCGISHKFNRSINAPFGLGENICKKCEKINIK